MCCESGQRKVGGERKRARESERKRERERERERGERANAKKHNTDENSSGCLVDI
jgi:hypothetical protein